MSSSSTITWTQTLQLIEEPMKTWANDWYSFQEAIAGGSGDIGYDFTHSELIEGNTPIYLMESGCQTSLGRWNCTAACMDPNVGPQHVWNSDHAMYTLQNCLVYPIIAAALANENVSDPNGLVTKYHILPDSEPQLLNTSLGWPIINDCIDTYCQSQGNNVPGCHSTDVIWTDYVAQPSQLNTSGQIDSSRLVNLQVNGGLCDNLPAPPNSDVAGIGVLLSFILQCALLVVAWIPHSISHNWIRRTGSVLGKERSHKANSLQQRLRESSHSAALVATLVEFHKTQVFFMTTIQIAAIAALRNTAFLEAASWKQLWNTINIMFDIAASGVDPILLNLIMLRRSDKASVYLLVGSAVSIGLSIVTWSTARSVNPSSSQFIHTSLSLPQCGGTVPTQYCLGDGTTWYDVRQGPSAFGTGWVFPLLPVAVFGCVATEKMEIFNVKDDQSNKNVYRFIHHHLARKFGADSVTLKTLKAFYLLAFAGFEVWIIYCNINDIAAYAGTLPMVVAGGQPWTLGQIIAVAVWAPVIVEYLYLTIGGLEFGFKYRLVFPYHISKTP